MLNIIALLRKAMKTETASDRRVDVRHKASARAIIEDSTLTHEARMLDVSNQGARFFCVNRLNRGQSVVARVQIGSVWTHLALKIVRLREHSNGFEYGCAVDRSVLSASRILKSYVARVQPSKAA